MNEGIKTQKAQPTGGALAAAALNEFARVMVETIDRSARNLGQAFASKHRSRVESISWSEHRNGDAEITVTLVAGHSRSGRGPGKLEALAALEEAIG